MRESQELCIKTIIQILMMMNCFCEMVFLQTAGSRISRNDHRQEAFTIVTSQHIDVRVDFGSQKQ